MTALFALARAVYFASVMTLFGAEAFAWLLGRAKLSGHGLSRKLLLIAASVALFAAIAQTLRLVWFGDLTFVRIALLVLLLVLIARPRRMPGVNALLAGAALTLMGASSHAAAPPHHVFGAINDAVHLLAAGFWIGSLTVLVKTALPRPAAAELAAVLRTFSSFGMMAVALLILAGTVNGVLILGGTEAHWAPGYVGLLALKLVLAALMIALALTNRFSLLPGLARGEAEARQALSTTIVAELVLSAGVLLVAGFLGMSAPLRM